MLKLWFPTTIFIKINIHLFSKKSTSKSLKFKIVWEVYYKEVLQFIYENIKSVSLKYIYICYIIHKNSSIIQLNIFITYVKFVIIIKKKR